MSSCSYLNIEPVAYCNESQERTWTGECFQATCLRDFSVLEQLKESLPAPGILFCPRPVISKKKNFPRDQQGITLLFTPKINKERKRKKKKETTWWMEFQLIFQKNPFYLLVLVLQTFTLKVLKLFSTEGGEK